MRYVTSDGKISVTEKEIKNWARMIHISMLAKSEAEEIYRKIEWFEDGFYFKNPLLDIIRIILLYGEETSLVALDNLFKEKEIKFTTFISLIDIVNDDSSETYKNKIPTCTQLVKRPVKSIELIFVPKQFGIFENQIYAFFDSSEV